MDHFDSMEKLTLFLHLNSQIKEEIDFLRDRQDKIFGWTSGILIAFIGALLFVNPTEDFDWASQFVSKLGVSLALLTFITFSVIWQQRTRRWQGENGQVMLKMQQIMHCYDEGYFDPDGNTALFPARWNKPPKEEIPGFKKRVQAANYVSATLVIGVFAIAMVWLR